MSKTLLKSTAVVSAMTLISRVTGLVRDVFMAQILGASALADAFNIAFRIPSFFRRIFGEGAFSQAFVPVFSQLRTQNTQHSREYVAATFAVLSTVAFFVSMVGILFAPAFIHLFAPGFNEDTVQFDYAVSLLRIMFPYLFCITLVAMSAGILNTTGRFAIPAVTPVFLNLCMIGALWFLLPFFDSAAQALAIGVLVAGVVQLLFQIPSLYQMGYLLRPRWNWRNPHVTQTMVLMLPAILSLSVAQINILINSALASILETGSISWLYYASRLMEFPIGLFGIALATVVLPHLSKKHYQGNDVHFSATIDWALRWVILIALPASVALYYLALPLVASVFQNTWLESQAFLDKDVLMSARALQAYAIGVLPIILVKILAPGFFARQDTKTPMRIALIAVLINIIVSLSLYQIIAHVGLALAISVAAWVNALLLFYFLLKQGVYRPQKGWFFFSVKSMLAVVLMVTSMEYVGVNDIFWSQVETGARFFQLICMIGMGVIAYFLCLYLLGFRVQHFLLQQ